MGRGRVEMKKIENKVNRQVTFSKRRNGLIKKATELSVLCDAEVALIIFSSGGKVYEFGSHASGVMHTLERYTQCSFTAPGTSDQLQTKSPENWEHEMMKLQDKLQSLEQIQRNLFGEDLESLNSEELQALEKQLEEALALTRQRQTHLMREQLDHLRKKERYLGDLNKHLKMKVQIEAIGQGAEGLWNNCRMEGSSSYANEMHAFQPSTMDCKPILQIGYPDYVPFDEGPSEQKGKMVAENEFLQVWDPLSSDFKLFRG